MTGGGVHPSPKPHGRAYGEIAIGAAVLAFGAMVWWQTSAIAVSPIYARVGPTVIPMMSAIGLMLMGVLLLGAAFRSGWQTQDEAETPIDRPALAWVVGGLLANAALIGFTGFTVASVVMFVCIARGFGSRAWLRNAAIGAAFALVAYFGFAKALGINIGAGPVERVIQSAFGI